jgi:hypothetical protein
MATFDYFSTSYREAREKFLTAARAASATISSRVLPDARGPEDEELAMDFAWLGPKDPIDVLVLVSGTHGVEGFAGSGCQVGYLIDRLHGSLPRNAAALLIHALNPHGFAWLRRVNEDNIDLNRNFQDFSKPRPSSAMYEQLHDWLVPADWDGPARKAADTEIGQYIARHGLPAFQAAVTNGQYTRPTGLFYGGLAETWSNTCLRQGLLDLIGPSVRRLVALDIHTGLGPTGYGEPIYLAADDRGFDRAKALFGPDTTRPGGGVATHVTGTLGEAIGTMYGKCETTCVALEFGTKPAMEVLAALRGDHWLDAEPGRETFKGEIKNQLRAAFYIDSSSWQTAVYGRTADLLFRVSRNLA